MGYQRAIRGLSEGYQWVIRGVSAGYQCGASSGGERLCPGICRVVGGTGHPRTTSSLPQFLSLSGPYSRDEEG